MPAFPRLPQFEYPGNAMVNFQPLSNAITAYKDAEGVAEKNAILAKGSNAMAEGRTQEAQAEYGRVDPRLAMEAGVYGLKKQGLEDEAQSRMDQQIAGWAQKIAGLQGEERASEWSKLVSSNQRIAAGLKARGIDPQDAQRGPEAIVSFVAGYQDPLKRDAMKAEIAAKDAETKIVPFKGENLKAQAEENKASAALKRAQAGQTQEGSFKTPKERAEVEHQIRTELHQKTKDFVGIRDGYGRVIDGQKAASGAGDLAIVYGYMKMLDPTSVVREGEFATAEQTTGRIPGWLIVQYNKTVSGERLPQEARTNFVASSKQLYERATSENSKLVNQYRGIARRYGIDENNVILDQTMANPPGAAASANGPTSGIPEGQPGSKSSPVYPPNPAAASELPPGTWFMTPEGQLRQRK